MICDYQSVECRYTFSEFLAFSYSSSYNLAPPITGRPEKVTIRKRRKKPEMTSATQTQKRNVTTLNSSHQAKSSVTLIRTTAGWFT